ncbi:MAG: ATP-binding protein [candidate division WOR-3 bacterium]
MRSNKVDLRIEEIKKILDKLEVPFAMLNKTGEVIFANEYFKEKRYSLKDILSPFDLENVKEEIEKEVKIGKKRVKVRIRVLQIENSQKVFLLEVYSLDKDFGEIISSWYKTIDAVKEMLYVVDNNYNLVKLNSAVAELSKSHPKELIGEKCYKAVFRKEEICEDCFLPVVMEREGKIQYIRNEWGKTFLVTGVKIREGEYLFVMEDVTKVKQLERNIAEIKKFNSIGSLISYIRHSVGNGINAIKCSLQVLEQMYEELDDFKRKEYLSKCLGEVNKIESLLATLKEFSRYEGIGSFVLDLTEVVLECEKNFREFCRNNGVEFKSKCEKKEFLVKGDAPLIVVALTEIIDNAIEAMEKSSKKILSFKYYLKEDEAVLEISDTGIGIPEENLSKIGEPFFTTKKERAGLGLYQATKIIKMQGGDIEFSSKVGKGTVVKVFFREYSG